MIWAWAGFIGFVLLMLALDLGVFHRKAHVVSVREALLWSIFWIALGVSFGIFVYFAYQRHWFSLGTTADAVDGVLNNGRSAVEKYLTGYVVEKSLSVDNIFVISVIFNAFGVPALYQHRVLFWGILGALVMRGGMIALGAQLIQSFHWVLYVFAVFLIITALRMLFTDSGHADPGTNRVVRLARRFFPVTERFHGQHFFVRAGSRHSQESPVPGTATEHDEMVERAEPGTLLLTPLALALLMVETTDLIFAVDSIPAIFAITADPFLVFTSNVFAILGLRSLYFALAGMVKRFRYLAPAIAAVLLVVGVKMLLADWLKRMVGGYFNLMLLGVVLAILTIGVLASLRSTPRD